MRWSAQMGDGLSLVLADETPGPPSAASARYPTARLCRGLLLFDGDADLSDEGVGFGVPVAKCGPKTLFPGALVVTDSRTGQRPRLAVTYTVDLVERLSGPHGKVVGMHGLYRAKDGLAALHRRAPALRRPLTATSSLLRASLALTTVYERTVPAGTVAVAYEVDRDQGLLAVEVDLGGMASSVGEAIVMNEQGAQCFDRYAADGDPPHDASAVATWDAVRAQRAGFVSVMHRVAFWASQAEGARLYRGRELVGARLAWAGFGYAVPPARGRLRYEIAVERLP